MSLNLKTPTDIEEMNEEDSSLYEKLIVRLHETVKKLPSANFYTTAKLMNHLKKLVLYAASVCVCQVYNLFMDVNIIKIS